MLRTQMGKRKNRDPARCRRRSNPECEVSVLSNLIRIGSTARLQRCRRLQRAATPRANCDAAVQYRRVTRMRAPPRPNRWADGDAPPPVDVSPFSGFEFFSLAGERRGSLRPKIFVQFEMRATSLSRSPAPVFVKVFSTAIDLAPSHPLRFDAAQQALRHGFRATRSFSSTPSVMRLAW